MKSVLIAGATGYVGSVMSDTLINEGYSVTGLDARPANRDDIDFIQADITKPADLFEKLEGKKFDWIFHLASLPSDTGDIEQMFSVNAAGTLNLLNWARLNKPEMMVMASSMSAYGWYPPTKFDPPLYMPVDEKHVCRTKDMYSSTKLIQEVLATTFYHQFGLNIAIIRLVGVIGPRGGGGGSGYLDMARQMKEGTKIKIPLYYEDDINHFVDIRDVARQFIATAKCDKSAGEIFVCCGPSPVTRNEYEALINDIVPGAKVEYGYPGDNIQKRRLVFTCEKAKRIIGFEPLYDMRASLQSIKDWADESL